MKRHAFALLGLAIIAVAAWTYNVNYNTRTTLDRVSLLRDQIVKEREVLRVLRVEWAYLNAPGRLESLVIRHNDKLRLVAVTPDMMGEVSDPPYVPDEEDVRVAGGGIPIPRARPVNWKPE